MPDFRSRFPQTFWLLKALEICPPHIDLEDVPGVKFPFPGLHHAELEHWRLSYAFWAGERRTRFIEKRIEQMSDEEFRAWCYQSPASLKAWIAWVCS